ncbi:MAG: hypothetical protein JSV49_08070 [Thermoplasmata archaeon]|nr:MAG: hypothetical protein JSV49_08070 [Thermoplasmata archaeon]
MMYCIECGAETKLYKNLCRNCFSKSTSFSSVSKYCNATICPTCNAMLRSKQWLPFDEFEEAVEKAVLDKIKIDPSIKTSNIDIGLQFDTKHLANAEITAKLNYEDLTLTESNKCEVRIKYEQCDVCSKMSAQYYSAIIQIRAEERALTEKEIDRCLDLVGAQIETSQTSDKSIFISKVEKIHGGYDIYLSHQNIAKSIAKNLVATYGGIMNSSSSMAGQKDGKEIFRMTYLVRLPKYQLGDVVKIEDKIVLVFGITNKKLDLIDLSNWLKFSQTPKRLKTIKIIANKSDYRKAQIISGTHNEFQVLDLSNYKTYDVPIPEHFQYYDKSNSEKKIPEEIYILNYENNIFLIPLIIEKNK